jgi:hypothetical protein
MLAAAGVLLMLSTAALAAGYKAGEGETVKSWSCRDYDNAKTVGQPLCVYFYNAKNSNNAIAKVYEDKAMLGDSALIAKLKPFLLLKIKTDGTAGKNWPPEYVSRAGAGATIMLASSDLKQTWFLDKDLGKEKIKPDTLLPQIDLILKYEEHKKKTDPPKKEAPPPVEEKKKPAVPGLPTDDDKKPDAKKPAKKKVDGPADE